MVTKRKDKRRVEEEVFTESGRKYQVKCNVILNDLKQALALKAIIASFEHSAMKRGNGGKNLA